MTAPLKGWHHTPAVPIAVSPFFIWPLQPGKIVRWVWNSWFLITERLITAVAGGLHLYFYTFTKQGQKLKFAPPRLMKNAASGSWSDSVLDGAGLTPRTSSS